MRVIIVSLEVNEYWLKEQGEKGVEPFSDIKEMLVNTFPDLKIELPQRNKLNINIYSQSQSSEVREAIKTFFQKEYQMTIANGDYRLNTKVYSYPDEPVEENNDVQEEEMSETGDNGDSDNSIKAKDNNTTNHANEETANAELENDKKEMQLCPAQLKKFLEEFDVIIKNAKIHKQEDVIWNTSLLISVDEGYGITSTLESIADTLEKNAFSFSSKVTKRVVEYKIPAVDAYSEKYWEKLFTEIETEFRNEKSNGKRSNTAPLIFCFDISEVMGSINKKELFEQLSQLARMKASYLYVFRIPFVEEIAFNKIFSVLEDIYMLRGVMIPPYSNQELVAYLKNSLKKRNVILDGNLDEEFERLIVQEKKDGRFWGFRTINRLVTDIVYHKLVDAKQGETLLLTSEDLKGSYEVLDRTEVDPMSELEQLSGMGDIKKTIDEIVAQIQLYNELKMDGKKLDAPCMHMRFLGNPGTGKTTVARLVAKIFKNKGILSKGYFYEIKARDLCGRYVGETAPKTSHYCNDALGSVLFIDEAYTLFRSKHGADYGQEAIDTLITEMENNRDNLVIIMAGYTKEMDELLEANPGLESRMPYTIEFKNYEREELVDIFYKMLNDNFSYTDGFDMAIRQFFASIPENVLKSETFSNARMVRNLYERIWSKAAYRRSVSKGDEIVLIEDDVQQAINDEEFRSLITIQNNKIGF